MHVSVSENDRFPIPLFAITPSRCVHFLNMISPVDIFDQEEVFRVKDDLIEECQNFGEVIALEIPRPCPKDVSKNLYTYSHGVGKLFVKFESILVAK